MCGHREGAEQSPCSAMCSDHFSSRALSDTRFYQSACSRYSVMCHLREMLNDVPGVSVTDTRLDPEPTLSLTERQV